VWLQSHVSTFNHVAFGLRFLFNWPSFPELFQVWKVPESKVEARLFTGQMPFFVPNQQHRSTEVLFLFFYLFISSALFVVFVADDFQKRNSFLCQSKFVGLA